MTANRYEANTQAALERPEFSAAVTADTMTEFDAITDQSWRKIVTQVDDPESMKTIDWTDTNIPSDLETRLFRLASIKANLPPTNRILQKDQHNITLENYKKLALATAGDLPTLNVFLEIMRYRLSTDPSPEAAHVIFDIWADTAEIIGRHDIKTDLEESAFTLLKPAEYQIVHQAYEHLGGDEDMKVLISDYSEVIGSIITEEVGPDIKFEIDGRRKSYYSVWRKVEKDKRPSYMLADFLGLRAVIKDSQDEKQALGDCYAVAGLVSQIFTPDLKRYKDYITNPKPNGYRSLHLTVNDISGSQIEFQVRTDDMHQKAESAPGVSHIGYDASTKITPGKYFRNLTKPHRIYEWRDMVAASIKQGVETGNESLEGILSEVVLAFAEDGNLYQLNEGDTVLDFAFAVHSRHALKLRYIQTQNSKASLALNQPVQFGQAFRLVTYRDRRLAWEGSWLSKVSSTRARKTLLKVIHHRDSEDLIASGIRAMDKAFNTKMRLQGERTKLSAEQLEILATIQDVPIHELLSQEQRSEIATQCHLPDFETVLRVIGQGSSGVKVGRLVNFVRAYLGLDVEQEKPDAEVAAIGKTAIEGSDENNYKLAIHGTLGFKHHVAGCCKIDIGDDVSANWSQASGDFAVHQSDCKNLATKSTTWACTWH